MDNNLIGNNNLTIKEALEKVQKSGQKLVGSLTDGDIRKFIINGTNLNTKITKIYNKRPKYLEKNNFSLNAAKQILLKYKLQSIAITKNKKRIALYKTNV